MNVKKKRVKKFRKLLVPRYLKGEVTNAFRKEDLKVYNKLRYDCFIAKPKVDDYPPKFNPEKYLNVRKLIQDAERLKQIDKENKQLLTAINIINRTTGKVDSWNPLAYDWKSSWKSHEDSMRSIEKNNKEIYVMIRNAGSQYSHKFMQNHWKMFLERVRHASKYPLTFINQPTNDSLLARLPSISDGLQQTGVNRPLCFLEFSVKGGPKLGRVLIELYHDYVPVTVQNFLTICSEQSQLTYKNCRVHRICPGKFIATGDITKGNGRGGKSIYGDKFFEEEHKLKHTKAGVLSMVRVGKRHNNSQFWITFGPMDLWDRRNVVFGKIIRGIDNLFKLEGYGRQIGKPLAEVYISSCGKV